MKTCSNCNIEKTIEGFSKQATHKDKLTSWCKSCQKEKATKYRIANKAEMQRYRLAHKKEIAAKVRLRLYGITSEELNQMFTDQSKACGICGINTSGAKTNWQVDHDHKTGKVRGILCMTCNIKLHPLEDAIWFNKAQKYLKK